MAVSAYSGNTIEEYIAALEISLPATSFIIIFKKIVLS